MTNIFKKLFSPLFSDDYQRTFGVARSPKWEEVWDEFLRHNPLCEVCETDEDCEVHHCIPFHIDKSKELDITNLITLCRVHHYLFGHLLKWASFNKSVREDVKAWRFKINNRP